jgi:hypothetical protein
MKLRNLFDLYTLKNEPVGQKSPGEAIFCLALASVTALICFASAAASLLRREKDVAAGIACAATAMAILPYVNLSIKMVRQSYNGGSSEKADGSENSSLPEPPGPQ